MKNILKKIKEIIINNRRYIIVFICMIIFLMILEDILDYEIQELDMWGYNIISKSISKYMTPVAKFITNIANWLTLILLTTTLSIVIKNKKIKWSIPVNLACSTAVNFILKNIIQRPRPTEFRIIDESGYSFPSGHSMASMAFYGYLIYLIFKYVKNRNIKIVSIFVLSVLIFLIGVSRIYLGVHYTSDVLGGFLLALSYLAVYTGILKSIDKKEEKDK